MICVQTTCYLTYGGKLMKKIIGVRFKRLVKIYFFDTKWLEVKKGDYVIV